MVKGIPFRQGLVPYRLALAILRVLASVLNLREINRHGADDPKSILERVNGHKVQPGPH